MSGEIHKELQAKEYTKTSNLPHRYLAYRDFKGLIKEFGSIKKVLDLGSGTGASSDYLYKNGYDVIGVDKSISMIKQAKSNYPWINFYNIKGVEKLSDFDLVFSCFVLFELSSKAKIIEYLNFSAEKLKDGGLFFGVTGSENLHQVDKKWACFKVDYPENIKPRSGAIVKLGLKNPKMVFNDYFWTESDYRQSFQASNLQLLKIIYPLGSKTETFKWKDELKFPPFVIFLARKIK